VTTTEIDIDAPPHVTHAVIADATTYPQWLVGAKRIRTVEPDWPAEGSSFHHAVGAGPLVIRDKTTVLLHPDESLLELKAHIGPLGSAVVRFRVEGRDDGRSSHLAIDEEPADGLVRVLWQTPGRPLVAAGLWGRNAVSLQSLRALIEERAQAGAGDSGVDPA
jgi:hypothetical protein